MKMLWFSVKYVALTCTLCLVSDRCVGMIVIYTTNSYYNTYLGVHLGTELSPLDGEVMLSLYFFIIFIFLDGELFIPHAFFSLELHLS